MILHKALVREAFRSHDEYSSFVQKKGMHGAGTEFISKDGDGTMEQWMPKQSVGQSKALPTTCPPPPEAAAGKGPPYHLPPPPRGSRRQGGPLLGSVELVGQLL